MFAVVIVAGSDNYAEGGEGGGGRFGIEESTSRERCRGRDRRDRKHASPFNNSGSSRSGINRCVDPWRTVDFVD